MSRWLAAFWLAWAGGLAWAQDGPANPVLPDFSNGASVFPHFWKPYTLPKVPQPNLQKDGVKLEIQDGVLRLSMAQVVAAVIANSLTVVNARFYPSIAQTDLLRSRSGQSPRGVDASVIPSVVFAGAEGGSILGTAGGSGGGASNAGGITGSATSVNIRPSGVFDPSVSFQASLDHTSSPLNTEVVAGIPEVTTTTGAYSLSYIEAFPSGTSFTFSWGYQRQSSNQLHLLFNPAFTPGWTATVSQQMLNGFGFKVNRALIEVAQNEQKIERESFRQQTIAALASAQNAYWDLIAAQESVRASQLALDAAEQLAANNRKEFDAGAMSRIDVVTADSQAASSRRDLVIARTNEQVAELSLKSLLTRNITVSLASARIEATDAFPEPGDDKLLPLDQLLEVAKQNRPDISVAEGNIKSEEDVRPFIKNSLLPNVNVFALVSTSSLYNVFGTSFVYAWNFKYPQFAFGLSISFSLRNRQAQADDVRSRLELRQAQDTLVRTKSQVEVDVQNAFIATVQSKQQVAAAREALRLAQVKLEAEQKKLDVGVSTSYNVVLDQRDVLTARLAMVQAQDAYAKAKVSLDQAMGTTFDTNHISMDEALSGQVKGF